MIPGIIAFFEALPALLTLISKLGELMGRLVKVAEQNDLNAWVNDLEKKINAIEKAKSSDEKFNAAKDLVGIIKGVGPK